MNGSRSAMDEALWRPDPARAAASQMAAFQRFCAERSGERIDDWAAFHRFSVADVGRFWRLFVEWSGIATEGSLEPACTSGDVATAQFFPEMRLSFTETLLDGTGADDAAVAVLEYHEDGAERVITRATLREQVARAAAAFQAQGLQRGDRVVALVGHDADTLISALAVCGLGAAWSSCGPELAVDAVLTRFTQLEPTVFIATAAIHQDGQTLDLLAKARQVAAALPTLRLTVFSGRRAQEACDLAGAAWPSAERPHSITSVTQLVSNPTRVQEWPRLPFDHPLFVLYSSGTTGAPKAIVHGVGGTLLEHLKEHRLHGDLRAGERLYFHTTCGWMMWHWTLSALASGAAIVTYDGSVAWPGADALWKLAERAGVSALGISPAFVQYSRASGVQPSALGLRALRSVMSTGSILSDHDFDWLATELPGVPVQSISGGTDIIGCFVQGNPLLPVWRGESQCVGLAMDVRALPDPDGGPDELVCAAPFPSRPVAFLHDADGSARHRAYFAQHPGLWTHGDFIALTARGSARILGRSDGVLKVRGVRIGPAEITSVVEEFAEIREAMAVEQRIAAEAGGIRIVLLVVLADGVTLDRPLTHRLKRAVRDRRSADHVPSVIIEVPALPVTLNGKRSERAARDAIAGRALVNRSALRNPEVLDLLAQAEGLRAD